MTNNERLRELMTDFNLTRSEVSSILHLSVTKNGQTPAVAKWLASPTDSSNFRHMGDAQLELLELRLGVRPLEVYVPKRSLAASEAP